MEKLEQQVRDRIAKLEADRDAFIQQANQQVTTINAVIGELKALIGENENVEVEVQPEKNDHKEIEKEKV